MSERIRSQVSREVPSHGGGSSGDPFGAVQAAGLVGISAGPYCQQMPVGGRTVAQVRARFGAHFDIDPTAEAVVDGRPASEDTVLRTGQMLTFTRAGGEKGGARAPRAARQARGSRVDGARRGAARRRRLLVCA